MKAWIVILAVSRVASADVGSAAPAACAPAGAPIYETDDLIDEGDATRSGTITRVYANGTWTRIPIKLGPGRGRERKTVQLPLVTGCLTRPSIAKIRTAIANAPWRVIHNRITCRAYSPNHTVYFINNERILDEHTCGADVFDERSYHALETIHAELHDDDPGSPPGL